MGRDTKSGDLTDLAGGVKKTDGDAVSGALREFLEESLECFGGRQTYNRESIKDCVCAFTVNMMIIFVHIPQEIAARGTALFKDKVRVSIDTEVNDLVWYSIDGIKKLANSYHIYGRPRTILRNMDFTQLH